MANTADELGPLVATALGDGWTCTLENGIALLALGEERLLSLTSVPDPALSLVLVKAYYPGAKSGKWILGPAKIKLIGDEITPAAVAKKITDELLAADDKIRRNARAR